MLLFKTRSKTDRDSLQEEVVKKILLVAMTLCIGCKSVQPQKIVLAVESSVPTGHHTVQKIPLAIKVEYHFDKDDKKVVQVAHEEIKLEK